MAKLLNIIASADLNRLRELCSILPELDRGQWTIGICNVFLGNTTEKDNQIIE